MTRDGDPREMSSAHLIDPMDAETIIVECGECGQPFLVPLNLFSGGPLAGELTVPPHARLEADGVAGGVCDGGHVPAMAKGTRGRWVRSWATEHPRVALPHVLDGSRARVRRIR